MGGIREILHIRWGLKSQMLGGYMICTEMYGSGVRIAIMAIILVRRPTEVLGRQGVVNTACCGAVRGSTSLYTAGRRLAAGANLLSVTSSADFGLCAVNNSVF